MYFPTSAARQLSAVPALPNLPAESVISLCSNARKSLFCTLTRNGLAVWRVRPSAVLAYLSRTPASLIEHGENVSVAWSPDSTRIVIQTADSYLVLVTLEYSADETVYQSPSLVSSVRGKYLAGPGEGFPLQAVNLRFEGVIRVEGDLLCVSPRRDYILFSTKSPPSVQRIPWPMHHDDSDEEDTVKKKGWSGYDSWTLDERDFPWLIETDATVTKISHSRQGIETWITSDGRAYFVQLNEGGQAAGNTVDPAAAKDQPNELGAPAASADTPRSTWNGTCIHNFQTPRWVQKRRRRDPEDETDPSPAYDEPRRAVVIAVNAKFSLNAIGTCSGSVEFTNFPSQEGVTPKSQTLQIPNPYQRKTGSVTSMEWSSDGYVLAVGWEHGWAIFSVGSRCLAWGFGLEEAVDEEKFQDYFMRGVLDLFWTPGNFELVVLAQTPAKGIEGQIFAIPFAKSSTSGQHAPDNTRYAFLQMDDRALVYRGADQPDMSVINPESDVWQHIKIPQNYLATNWPIRYSSLSSDGRLIAIAGRRGLIHYSSTSGRWKLFEDTMQEQAFTIKGGLLWFHHVLIAAVEVARSYQIRLYSRDLELSSQNVLHREVLASPVVIMSIVDNSLLVYTADNTLHHYLIIPTADNITLHLCGSITFDGIIAAPGAVRLLSWMIPSAQKQLGDPVEDLNVATVLMMVGGQLVLLRPRKSGDQEVKYDMQIFADRIEFCWTHLRGIGALENSLWAYDGQGIRVWLNALAIEAPTVVDDTASPSVKESVNIPLDFYPLSVLMDKGIIIGAEHETATRKNLPFVMFRHATSSHLFLHHILLCHLEAQQVREAVVFAAHYQHLVFFAHALEILLHNVVESDASLDAGDTLTASRDLVLSTTIDFLDHFDAALEVVVGCARKTEMTRWPRLFSVVGNPKSLFETCLGSDRLKTASSYLLVLHNLEQLDENSSDAIRLLRSAIEAKDWQLCKELLRFLHSIDDTGTALRNALAETSLIEVPNGVVINGIEH
ncbi:RIC1-domain-containing protein [Athelia psychrophila]|uniref:RIC1-domain-containing protein n=1 Tax=Athelia psychrophila TaxID=1759441 RepID=A0A166FFT2_9AGAM|nr:RIC1-domain-containing protein [Fibularhizoctonia sp. CBS 109695]